MEIENWLKEFKEKYKVITIYQGLDISPIPNNYEDISKKLSENEDFDGEHFWLEFGFSCLEELGVFIRFLRGREEVKIIDQYEYPGTSFSPYSIFKSYNSFEDLREKSNFCVSGSWIAVKIYKDSFMNFWKDFIQYCIDYKYVFKSYLDDPDGSKGISWFKQQYNDLMID